MRGASLILLAALALLLAACVPSLNPLYTSNELVYDPGMEGTWTEKEGHNTWVIRKGEDKAYEIRYTEKGVPAGFEGHLVALGDHFFLDLYPAEPGIRNDFYKGHLIRAHTFGRITRNGDQMQVAMLNPDWLEPLITQKKISLEHARIEDGILLTAPTAALQELIRKHVADPKAFTDPVELIRQKQ